MIKRKLLVTALALTLSAGMFATATTSVFASDKTPATTESSSNQQTSKEAADKDFIKVSDDAMISLRDVHGARLAIFNGDPDKALTYVDAAVARIDAAVEDADKYALDTKAPKADDSYVPVDASLSVMNTFEPTAENAKHISTANTHLHQGEKKKAIEALKLAQIDVAVTTSMLPVKFAKDHIAMAAKLVADQKYYEANLALKAVDDAVIVETYAIDAVPKSKAESDS